jgi:hypothetical protein
MSRLVKYFFVGYLIAFITVFSAVLIKADIKLALLLGAIFGVIAGLMSMGFMFRILKVEEFEITMQNKHPKRGFDWYEDEIKDQLAPFHYYLKTENGIEIFSPRSLYKIYEPQLEFERTPYQIRVKGSRLMIKLLKAVTEIN